MINQLSKYQIATIVAVIFHTVGIVGILILKSDLIITTMPFVLVLNFSLLVWTHENKNSNYWLFTIICIAVGLIAEMIGVNTAMLFGKYSYGSVLGAKLNNVPLVIGFNWFMLMLCCGVFVNTLWHKVNSMLSDSTPNIKPLLIVFDAATLATAFDWLMEPVAIKLGMWQWSEGQIPSFNYACWFVLSFLLLVLFQYLKLNRQNKFAIHLLMIQAMFFLLLRVFL